MSFCIQGLLLPQVNAFRDQLLGANGINLLKDPVFADEMSKVSANRRERLFSPQTTLWIFLCQVLNPDKSCRAAVIRFSSFLSVIGKKPCSTLTGAYCKARKKITPDLVRNLVLKMGEDLEKKSAQWRWKNRVVKLVDGCTVGLADTIANQKKYPQNSRQLPGLGFPLIRICTVISLASGALVDAGMAACQGKGTGENSILRSLLKNLSPGDILVADRFYCSFWLITALQALQIDCAFRLNQKRKPKKLKRLGKYDWLVRFEGPKNRISWLDQISYHSLPKEINLRVLKIHVPNKGYRTRVLFVATTLVEDKTISHSDIAELYGQRWNVELDIRNIKQSLYMDFLRCKTPELVNTEIWVHLLAYNLIRAMILRASEKNHIAPRKISFTAAMQTVRLAAELVCVLSVSAITDFFSNALINLGKETVGNRPGRTEPRALKNTRQRYRKMVHPRALARKHSTHYDDK